MKLMKVKLTLEQLENLLEAAKNEAEYHDMRDVLFVSINQLPNGKQELEFEQPCQWTECNSSYHRFTDQS